MENKEEDVYNEAFYKSDGLVIRRYDVLYVDGVRHSRPTWNSTNNPQIPRPMMMVIDDANEWSGSYSPHPFIYGDICEDCWIQWEFIASIGSCQYSGNHPSRWSPFGASS